MGRRDEPLVSVLIPTFNSAVYLREALTSAQDQTYRNIEILIADNASTDATLDIAREAAADDPRIKIFAGATNIGLTPNLRRCLELASGEYAKFLMSDDVLAPEITERLLEPMRSDPSVVLAAAKRDPIDEDSCQIPEVALPASKKIFSEPTTVEGTAIVDLMLEDLTNYIGEPTNVLIRTPRDERELAEAFLFRGRDFHSLPDMAHWLTILRNGRLHYIPETMAGFRRHSGQYQQRPEILAQGLIDWLELIRAAWMHGYLQSIISRQRALHAYAMTVRMHVLTLDNKADRFPLIELLRGALSALDEMSCWREDMAKWIDELIVHSTVRASLPRSLPARAGAVASELRSGRYFRYSLGFRSAAKDLVVGAATASPPAA